MDTGSNGRDEPPDTHVQFRLEPAQNVLLAGIQGAIESVSAGLLGLQAAPEALDLPGVRVGIRVGGLERSAEETETDVRARILAGGLRECADAIGGALMAAYHECQLWAQPGTVVENGDGTLSLTTTTTGAWWNDVFVAGARRFERLSLPEKIEQLEGIGLAKPAYTSHILTLNAARNCLSHRGGVVGPRDLKEPEDDALTVTWRRVELRAVKGDVSREIGPGSTVEQGEMVQFEVAPTSRSFALGERVTFTTDDFAEIAQTFMFYAQQIGAGIVLMQRARLGLQVESDPAARH